MSTAAEYREQLKALLPPGQAFPRDPGTTLHDLLDGMSIELARVDDRASTLPQEVNPNTTLELLSDWERVAGLPDKCSGTIEETLQGRRNALLAKLTSTGGQSADYFIQLAASLGFSVMIEVFRPFRVGSSVAGDVLSNGDWAFAWRIRAPDVTVIPFRAGLSVAGERLRVWGSDTLECKIRQLAPAHTIPIFAYGDATLDLNFVQDTYRSGANNTTFAGLITFTRSSTGTYFDAAGVLQTAAINAPRFDHHPVTKAPLGLMIEAANTNLATNSESINVGIGVTITPNSRAAPDANMTADLVVETSLNGEHYGNDINLAVTAGQTMMWSCFVADGPSANREFYLRLATGVSAGVKFNPRTKTLTNIGAASSGFVELANGWFRVWLTAVVVNTGNLVGRLQLMNNGASIYTGDNTSGMYMWGRQLCLAEGVDSYIPTGATAVTRAADVAAVNTLTPWFSPARGTLYAEATNFGTSGSTIAQIGTLADRNYVAVAPVGVPGTGGGTVVGGTSQAGLQAALGAPGQKVAYAYSTNDFACAVNGALTGTDTSGALPTPSSMLLGSYAAGGITNCYIRQITYSPKRLSNERLQAMTAP
jgi:uncharacterized protein YmfQ (DUF2313 family)